MRPIGSVWVSETLPTATPTFSCAVSRLSAPLPVTETGYRSHFLAQGVVEGAGGSAAYAIAWLDAAAKGPAWRRQQEAVRQLCLF